MKCEQLRLERVYWKRIFVSQARKGSGKLNQGLYSQGGIKTSTELYKSFSRTTWSHERMSSPPRLITGIFDRQIQTAFAS